MGYRWCVCVCVTDCRNVMYTSIVYKTQNKQTNKQTNRGLLHWVDTCAKVGMDSNIKILLKQWGNTDLAITRHTFVNF